MKAAGELIPVFEINGRTYYQYANEEKIPPLRAFAALDFYDAIERKTDQEYLEAFCKAVLELVNQKKIGEIAILTHFLYERTQNLTNFELVYDLATVLYLDETEDPNEFDYNFAYEKKQLWKSEEVSRFFLRTPLINYLPYSKAYKENLKNFTIAGKQKEKLITQLTNLIPILSGSAENNELVKRLQLRVAMLESSKNC